MLGREASGESSNPDAAETTKGRFASWSVVLSLPITILEFAILELRSAVFLATIGMEKAANKLTVADNAVVIRR